MGNSGSLLLEGADLQRLFSKIQRCSCLEIKKTDEVDHGSYLLASCSTVPFMDAAFSCKKDIIQLVHISICTYVYGFTDRTTANGETYPVTNPLHQAWTFHDSLPANGRFAYISNKSNHHFTSTSVSSNRVSFLLHSRPPKATIKHYLFPNGQPPVLTLLNLSTVSFTSSPPFPWNPCGPTSAII